jgi:hypothetical protein
MATKPTNTDTSDFEGTQEWTEIDDDFGEKISWEIGTVFTGEFQAMRTITMDDGKPATTVEFTCKGDKFYTWAPARLKGVLTRALDDGVLATGATVQIKCTGEEVSGRKGMSPSKTFSLKVAK